MNVLPLLLCFIAQSVMAENASEHKEAIQIAREGNSAKALQMLESVSSKTGWYDALIYDYIVILTWAKRDLEAYTFFHSKVNKALAPPYVLEAIALACRHLKLFSESQVFYRLLKEKEPHNSTADIGLATIEVDLQNFYEAIVILTKAEKKFPGHIPIYLLLGKAYYAIEKYTEALRYYNKVLTLKKDEKEAIHGQALCLNQLKSPFEALEKARKAPHSFSENEIQEMEANRAATLILWGRIDRDDVEALKDRYVYLDRSIADLKEQIDRTENPGRKLRLRFDLIVAFVFRNRHEDALEEYEGILNSGKTIEDIPPYVLEGVGDSFLTLRQPEKAKEVFNALLITDPKNPRAIEGYFYAMLECNEPEKALDFIKNNKREGFTYKASLLYGNLLSLADDSTRETIQVIPMNTSIRTLRGNVLQARGLPRAAEREYDIGLTNSPDTISLLLGKARVYLSLNEPHYAEQIMNKISETYPENLDLKRFKEEWKSYNAIEFDSQTSLETGDPEDNLTTDNRLYSQTFAHHYRAFLSGSYQWGIFNKEGILNQRLGGVGIEYRHRNIRLLGEVNSTLGGKTRYGAVFEAEYTPIDTITLLGKAEIMSRQTPGRAILNNVTSNYYQIGFGYYKNESFQLGISGFLQNFSDKNTSYGTSGFVKTRVMEKPRQTLDVRLDVGTRFFKNTDGPYYSPVQDGYVNLSSVFTQLLCQRYEHSLTHIITPDIGQYWQKTVGNHLIFGISYEHRWKYQNWYEIGYGISRRRSFYDDKKEYSTIFLLKVNFKF